MVVKYGDLYRHISCLKKKKKKKKKKRRKKRKDNYLLSTCDKLPQEKLHLKFCKYILGVSSRNFKFPEQRILLAGVKQVVIHSFYKF